MPYKFNIFTGTFDIVSAAVATVVKLLLEDSSDLLLEDGTNFLMES